MSKLEMLKALKKRIIDYWFSIAKFWRYIIVASVVTYSVHFLDFLPYISKLENLGMDVVMKLHKNRPAMEKLSLEKNGINGLVFVDIDQEHYELMGEPFYMPRDEILEILIPIVSRAKVVMLDFNINKKGVTEKTLSKNDLKLKKFIEGYNKKASLLLVVSYKEAVHNGRVVKELKPFEYFDIPKDKNVYLVRPEYLKDTDGIVRSFFLSQPVCGVTGVTELSLSPSLTVDLLLSNENPNKNFISNKKCGDSSIKFPESITYGIGENKKSVQLNKSGEAQKILYTLDSNNKANFLKQYGRVKARHVINPESNGLTTIEQNQWLDGVFTNKFVVIGSSYYEGGDIHKTPLGKMPGALIIVNAFKSLTQWGQLRTPPIFLQLLLLLPIIVLIAWCYTRFSPLLSTCLVWGIVGTFFISGSIYLLSAGLWLDFVTPLLAIETHRALSGFLGNDK